MESLEEEEMDLIQNHTNETLKLLKNTTQSHKKALTQKFNSMEKHFVKKESQTATNNQLAVLV